MAYPTTTHQYDIEAVHAKLKGTLLLPEDTKFNAASQPWHLSAGQHPAFVVMAAPSKGIQQAVKFANENGHKPLRIFFKIFFRTCPDQKVRLSSRYK